MNNKRSYIMISELSLANDSLGRTFIYPSLIDFYAETYEQLAHFTQFMYESGMFTFLNTGRCAGMHNGMAFAFDDGQYSFTWLRQLFTYLFTYNSMYSNAWHMQIKKRWLLESYIKTPSGKIVDSTSAETMVNAFIHTTSALAKKYGYSSLLKVQLPKKSELWALKLADDKLYLSTEILNKIKTIKEA